MNCNVINTSSVGSPCCSQLTPRIYPADKPSATWRHHCICCRIEGKEIFGTYFISKVPTTCFFVVLIKPAITDIFSTFFHVCWALMLKLICVFLPNTLVNAVKRCTAPFQHETFGRGSCSLKPS